MNLNEQGYQRALAHSLMISADMAHAYQPNFPNAYEPGHKICVNQGPVIKLNANHRYASTCLSEAAFVDICRQAEVPFQRYAHRGDLPCGSTIGPLTAANVGVRTLDVGVPTFAMHSPRELAGANDLHALSRVLARFFRSAAL